MRDQQTSELAQDANAHSVQRMVMPRLGEVWNHMRHGKVKLIEHDVNGYIADILSQPGRREYVRRFYLTEKATG